MDSCHGQLDDKKFHVMLWSETVIRDWIFEPEYAVLILTPSTLGKIWEIIKKNLLHSRILPPCGGNTPQFLHTSDKVMILSLWSDIFPDATLTATQSDNDSFLNLNSSTGSNEKQEMDSS